MDYFDELILQNKNDIPYTSLSKITTTQCFLWLNIEMGKSLLSCTNLKRITTKIETTK